MSATPSESLAKLAIPAEKKVRKNSGPSRLILIVLLIVAACIVVFFVSRHEERKPIPLKGSSTGAAGEQAAATNETVVAQAKPGDVVLTVSGYVIPHERIEISPRFQGTVERIDIKKGDKVRKGDVLVLLEQDEFEARLKESAGRLEMAKANLANAEVNLTRQRDLARNNVDSVRALDQAIRDRDVAAAEVKVAEGQQELAKTYLDWCTIRAPIDGTILEKLVNPNELVSPQSYGGTRGPSTAFLAMADLMDLQVEIDLNESDTPKVALGQKCKISPEAYPDRSYEGFVAEIAPEANRSKGTLQVKVQVLKPDGYLTPELTAKVDFLPIQP